MRSQRNLVKRIAKDKQFFLIIVMLALFPLVLPTYAQTVDVFQLKGKVAYAGFSSTDPLGCIVTDVIIVASKQIVHEPPGPGTQSAGVVIAIFREDVCTCAETSLLEAFGSASLTDQEFQIDSNLGLATLKPISIEVSDTSGSSFNVDLALTWTGVGQLSRANGHLHFRSPGFTFNGHLSGVLRDADASGSLSDGTTSFIQQPPEFAGIASVRFGRIAFNR